MCLVGKLIARFIGAVTAGRFPAFELMYFPAGLSNRCKCVM